MWKSAGRAPSLRVRFVPRLCEIQTRDTVRKEERIGIARATGKSAMANMILKRARSKNGDMRMPQDLTWKIF